jgi:3-methyl-2-oxobutanoate hydroxymethyltransferase
MSIKINKLLKKKDKKKIVCLTAYSKNIAKILDKHCDIILVGDSMANVLYGLKNTHKITLQNIIEHTLSVKKGIKKSLLIVDMPKGSYQNVKLARRNAKISQRLRMYF